MYKDEQVIIKFDGRMANQMFQWAFGRAYQKQTNIMPCFDDSRETLKLGCFKLTKDLKLVKKSFFNKFLRKTIPFRNLRNNLTEMKFNEYKHFNEKKCFVYEPDLLEKEAPAYISGFFQTEKYFMNIRETLLSDFELKKNLNKKNNEILEKIKNTNSVSVHFRMGDYLKKRVSDIFGTITPQYYFEGIEKIVNITNEKPVLFIFSDDINRIKKEYKFKYETVFVDVNSGKQGYFDLELMKNCKHNVIANSSFSWWGAWLNNNKEKVVIAPKYWQKNVECRNGFDILPDNWICL